MPGPPPKRAEERRRRNKDTIEVTKVDLDAAIAGEVAVPTAEENWHPVAAMIYASAISSGQAIFYEPSDFATLFLQCDIIDRWYQPQPVVVGTDSEGNPEYELRVLPMPGATLTALNRIMASLMMNEGDRRKARIELDRKAARDAAVAGDGKVVPISKQRQARFAKPVQK